MNGFERRKEKKIEQIYSASFQLFAQYGFQKVSVNEIAHKARVSPATVYNYFGTKERLYMDMLMDWMDKQLLQYEEILAEASLTFPEKTKKIMLLEIENLKLLANELINDERTDFMQSIEVHSEQKIADFFIRYVRLGKDEGYIHREQSEEVAMLYFTMFKNELGRHMRDSSPAEFSHTVDRMLELFFYGLAGQVRKS
ncbi:TetR/AcrR family transcriptional regulator [Paenibacillus sp. GCM10027626]|uniref:TetR/AcrR family transcriptional regulator n=1 Tax=Paenibacillus sp. GCM10027626 TaxID=3273411 RepID=UPI00363DDEAD